MFTLVLDVVCSAMFSVVLASVYQFIRLRADRAKKKFWIFYPNLVVAQIRSQWENEKVQPLAYYSKLDDLPEQAPAASHPQLQGKQPEGDQPENVASDPDDLPKKLSPKKSDEI